MPVTVRCPCCQTALEAPDELVGTSARCEDCGQTFVVRRPKAKASATGGEAQYPYRYEGLEAKEPDDDRDDDRPRPRRRRPAARRPNYVPAVIAAAAVFGLLLVVGAGAAYFLLANRKADPPPQLAVMPAPVMPQPQFPMPQPVPGVAVPGPPAPPAGNGEQVTLSNPQWGGGVGGDFRVSYQFAGGRRPIGGLLTVVFQFPNGDRGTANFHPFDASGTVTVHIIGPGGRGGPLNIWVEQGGFPGPFGRPGTKISNTVTLN